MRRQDLPDSGGRRCESLLELGLYFDKEVTKTYLLLRTVRAEVVSDRLVLGDLERQILLEYRASAGKLKDARALDL